MLTRPLTLNETDDRGRDLTAVTPPPALPLADEGDDDDETQMGVFSPPVPPWSSSSSSSSSPPFCGSSSPSAPPLNPPPSFLSSSSLTPPPPPPAQSLIFSVPAPPLPPPVFFAHHTLPTSSSFSPSLPPPPSASSDPFISPYPVSPPHAALLPPVCPPPPTLPPPSYSTHLDSIIPAPSTVSPPSSSHFSSPMSSSPLVPVSLLSSPVSPPLPVAPPSSLLPPHVAPAPLPPPVAPLPVALSPPPPSPSPVAPSLPAPPPLPPPCCPCSSLLPRLLSAHRLEVRRLLRGALASLGRRLDSLERKSRRKKRKKRSRQREDEEGAACSGSADLPFTSASSCSSAHLPPVTIPSSSSLSSSSSDSEDSPTPPVSSSLSQSEQRKRSRGDEEGEGRRRKKRRKNHRRREMNISPENREEDEEEAGRFVGRMAVSFRRGEGEGGEKEELPLTLHHFNHRKHKRREGGRHSQSQKTISVVRENGYTAPLLLHSISSFSSQRGWTSSQSEALSISSGQWHFSELTLPLSLSSNHSTLNISLCSSALGPAPMLRLSAVAVETISESVRGGAYWSPLQPLKDWTAPPSLSSDHCYVRTLSSSTSIPARRQQKQRANHSSRSLHLPRRRALPLPLCSANGLSAPLPVGQSAAGTEFLSTNGERGKRVSQIRIRRASPRETPLTPMGLPKVKRLKKKEFSLEEIYTNKNYKSPTTNRSLETIFEEPREKDGEPLVIGQQRRRRLLLFPDFTQPRKRKRPQGAGLPVAMVPRKRAAARRHCHGGGPGDDESDLDVMLVERLSALEDFLTRQGLDV